MNSILDDYARLPLRVHSVLSDVRLHDVWALDLPRMREGITLHEFLLPGDSDSIELSPAARALFALRVALGKAFGWDRESGTGKASFASRLSDQERQDSLVPVGTRDGVFQIVYQLENERLSEIENRTVHAAKLEALVEEEHRYRFYLAIYVRDIGVITSVYMAAIEPFRRWIVYPSFLRGILGRWNRAFPVAAERNSEPRF